MTEVPRGHLNNSMRLTKYTCGIEYSGLYNGTHVGLNTVEYNMESQKWWKHGEDRYDVVNID